MAGKVVKKTLQDSVDAALELLPAVGQKVEFDAFKAQLYTADPDNGRDAFAYMIKQGLMQKKLEHSPEGGMSLMLSRKA